VTVYDRAHSLSKIYRAIGRILMRPEFSVLQGLYLALHKPYWLESRIKAVGELSLVGRRGMIILSAAT